MMKNLISLVLMLCLSCAAFSQTNGNLSGMTREQFREYKENYLKKELNLNDDVCSKFFPIYEDYQNKKQINYKKNQALMERAGIASEAEYRELIEQLQALEEDSDKLEKSFFEKAKTILTYEQLFKLGKAEANFQKHLLRELTRKGKTGK